jgi:CDP-glucose 4,6-dehydratase
MDPAFWHGKHVLVTGHTGFKGAWLCMLLDLLGARVAGFALEPPTKPSLFELARVDDLVDSTIGDVRELAALTDRVRSLEPEFVIHMAAQSVVLRSYEDPVETFATNVMGTVHLLDAIRNAGRPCSVINVTTDKVYENKGLARGYRESDELGGHDPYSSSKACAELVGHSYRDSFFPLALLEDHRVALASARAGNVIGGGDWTPRQLIPDSIAAFRQVRPVVLRHPNSVRPWQHVLDCLAGYLTLAEAISRDPQAHSGAWNFGPEASESRPVSYVVETLAKQWGISNPWIQDSGEYPHEEAVLRLDVTKAGALPGAHGRLAVDEAIRWVADWYRDFHDGQDARTLCLGQIRTFLGPGSLIRA